MTPRRLHERMKARIAMDRREDLRTGVVATSIYKSAHGRRVQVKPEDFAMGPREKRERSEEEQVAALEAFLAPFRVNQEEEDGEDAP